MSRVTLALALASSVSGLLLPARIPAGNKVRGDCSGGGMVPAKVPARVGDVCSKPLSAARPSTRRSLPLYMSIDPEALVQPIAFLTAGFAGFLAGQNAVIAQIDEPSPDLILPQVEELRAKVEELQAQVEELRARPEPTLPNPVVIPPAAGDAPGAKDPSVPADPFEPARVELFERFDKLSLETKKTLNGCVDELLNTTNPQRQDARDWWAAWQRVNADANAPENGLLRTFFEQWLVYAIVPNGTAMLPSEEHPAGNPNSPGYFIENWDFLANTKLGLSLNAFDKEWRAWFVEFLEVRGLFIESKQSFPPDVKAAWEGNATTKAYSAPATGKSGQHPFNLSSYLLPPGGFDTFNGFFLRWVRDFATNRPLEKVAEDVEPYTIVSPADGGQFFLSNESTTADRQALPGKFDKFNVVEAFPGYGEKFVGGPLLDQLLWFTDFHHFFAPVSGTLISMHVYPGSYNYDFYNFDPYHPDLPKPTDNSNQAGWYQQLARHKRFVWIFKTEKLGLVGMAAIGFWGVGSIVVDKSTSPQTWAGGPNARNEPSPGVHAGKGGDLTPVVKIGDYVTKGSYLGHFGYGGSSIILAFQPEVDGTALTYNFSATPAGAKVPVPFSIANLTGASIQVNALQQIGVAFPDATVEV